MLNLNLPVATADCSSVRIICKNRRSPKPIVALLTMPDGHEIIRSFTRDGRCNDNPQLDLFNKKEATESEGFN